MATDAANTVAGFDGGLWVADVGTAFPADIDTAPGAGWTDLGAITTDGPTFSEERTSTEIKEWRQNRVLRVLNSEKVSSIKVNIMEILNTEAFLLIMNGGSFSSGKYTPPSDGASHERAIVLDIQDGTSKIRFLVQRATNAASTEFATPSDDLANTEVELKFLAPTSGEVYEIDSNLTAWGAA